MKSDLGREILALGVGNFGPNGNLTGMRQNFGWQDVRPVKIGAYVYNLDSRPDLYERAR